MPERTMAQLKLSFTLNGEPTTVEIPEDAKLLEVLRDHCGVTSPKNGCAPQGMCGACTVLVDDKPTMSCVLAARRLEGRRVTTLEGLSEAVQQSIAGAFVATGGLQCGFCTPGLVVRSAKILEANPHPSREEVARGLRPHVCRCTGYTKIVDAVQLAGDVLDGRAQLDLETGGRVGTRLPKYRAMELALGQHAYVDDMKLPGMLTGALLTTPSPRYRLDRIDVSRAQALPGVEAVLTYQDVPGERFRGLIYQDWPLFVAEGECSRYIGDVLAVVAARDLRTARTALELIEYVGEVLPPVTDPEVALQEDAPRIHPQGNLLSVSQIRRGDVDAALAASAHVVTGTWTTQFIEHAYLEPEAVIAAPDGDGLRVWSQSQGIFDDQKAIAEVLGIPRDRVRVTLVNNGGGFGGKEDLLIQGHAAILAMKLQRPVKITLSRSESIRMHSKRHPIKMTYTVGCDAQGNLTAVRARMIGDKGAYSSVGSKVLERAAGHAGGPYRMPNVDVEAKAVYTNNPPCGAMRGFGANQAAFALEGCLDMLAERLGMDRWDIRYQNALDVGDVFVTGQVLEGGVGIKQTLLAVRDAFKAARYAGIGCGVKNTGLGNGMPDIGRATLVVEPDASITIYHGFTEMGQGLFTVGIQTAVEETGLPAEVFRTAVADTRYPNDCGMTTASRGSFLACHGIQEAAKQLRAELDGGKTLEELIGKAYQGERIFDYTTKLNAPVAKPITHVAFSYATQVVILDDEGKLKQVIAAHDVGKALNPMICEGQIEGAVHMGLGYALSEDLNVVDGVPRNTTMRSLGILGATDMPEVAVILIEEPDPVGPYGAKGVGEIGLVPTAGAVQGALHAFDGIRRYDLPMRDAPAAKAIRP